MSNMKFRNNQFDKIYVNVNLIDTSLNKCKY